MKNKGKKQTCENCGNDKEELYELAESKCCEDCWLEYWKDNEIGLDTSFNDFLNHTCTKLK